MAEVGICYSCNSVIGEFLLNFNSLAVLFGSAIRLASLVPASIFGIVSPLKLMANSPLEALRTVQHT